jgi:hypothetical protein
VFEDEFLRLHEHAAGPAAGIVDAAFVGRKHLPVATAELKSDFTQSVVDAVDQYRFDRDPAPKGTPPEPLLSFPGGALVHFAVSNSEVQMTTRLAGKASRAERTLRCRGLL